MSEENEPDNPNEPNMFRFIESGMRISFEFDSIGELEAGCKQTIKFYPVLTSRGWSDHKQYIESLRVRHFSCDGREIGHCLLDRDEIAAFNQLLLQFLEGGSCRAWQLNRFEYVTRHGIVFSWNHRYSDYSMQIASPQTAALPKNFMKKLIEIFGEFDAKCDDFK